MSARLHEQKVYRQNNNGNYVELGLLEIEYIIDTYYMYPRSYSGSSYVNQYKARQGLSVVLYSKALYYNEISDLSDLVTTGMINGETKTYTGWYDTQSYSGKYNEDYGYTKIAFIDEYDLNFTQNDKFAYLNGVFFPTCTYSLNMNKLYTLTENGEYIPVSVSGSYTPTTTLPAQNATLVSAPNFSDEENPTITYSRAAKEDLNIVGGIQAVISIDGTNDDIVRDIDLTGTDTSITFELTEEERNILRQGVTSGISTQVLFRIKTIPTEGVNADNIPPYYSDLSKTLTLIGAYPSANPDVEDINEATLALTGDKNTLIKYYSDASYSLNAYASKGATIVSYEINCGNKIGNTPTGVLEDVENSEFTFLVVDSRNNAVSGTLTKNFIDYIKLTCQQQIEIDLSGAEGTGAAATVKISGNYFNGSFGAVDNSLVVQIRHTQNDGSMGDWVTLTDFMDVSISNNSYSLDFGISGLDYAEPYTFQCRAIDKLDTAETAEYTTRVMPVFDWSGEDFNFNVPVNINADTLNMANSTVIRHTGTNTVLSGNNGSIYIRPGGTDDTSNETIFYGNGNIKFGGAIDLGDSFTIGGNALNDFVIESGETSMGSNGTWYWQKWASGKAECWGCRNFGTAAVTTAWGSLFRSAVFAQELPDGLFKTVPEVININMVNAGSYGCWIAKHEQEPPSAVTTGSFILVRPAGATITPSYVGFDVKGFWK